MKSLRRVFYCLGSLIGFISSPLLALEDDFITFGGIDSLASAFRYVALFFSNDDYGGLVYIAAIVGFAVAGFVSLAKQATDVPTMRNWILTFGISVSLYTALIVPTGTIHIFDRTLNRTESIAGVPDGIILLAGLTNTIEEAAVDIANTVSINAYDVTANGIIFDMIRRSFISQNPLDDEYLWQNIKTYYLECGQVAAAIPGSGFNLNAINKSSTDLLATFANAQSQAISVPYKSAANPNGVLTTCTDAYSNIRTELVDPGTYSSLINSMCRGVGFNTVDAGQLGQCEGILDNIIPTVFGQTGDRTAYLQAAVLAMAIQDAAADQNPERAIAQETNRRFTTQGLGLFTFAQEYGQSIRAGFLAAALTSLVVVSLFFLTPLRGRALSLAAGFFVFVAVWGIIDIGLQIVIEDIALGNFEEVRRNNLSFSALMLAPNATLKALSVFGASRLISISLASIIVITVFKLSGAGFSNLVGSLTRHGDDIAGGAAEARLNPESLAEGVRGRARAAGELQGYAISGDGAFQSVKENYTGGFLQDLGQHAGFRETARGNGFSGNEAYSLAGVSAGASTAGRLAGLSDIGGYSASGVKDAAATEGRTSASRGVLDAIAFESAAENLSDKIGVSVPEARALVSQYDHALTTGRISGANGDASRAFATSSIEEQQRIGSALGVNLAALHNDLTPSQLAEASSYLDTQYRVGDVDYKDTASVADLSNIATAGEIRRARVSGEARGVGESALFSGQPTNSFAANAAAINASQSVLSAERVQNLAENLGISTNDVLFNQGSNFQLAANDRTLGALAPFLTEDQLELARPGSNISFTYDPLEGEIGQIDVRSGQSVNVNDAVQFQSGVRFDGRQGTEGGLTVFRFADLAESGNLSGASQFSRLFEAAESEGSGGTFIDSISQQAASHLNGIAGKDISYYQADTETGSKDVFAGVKASGGPPKLFGIGINAEVGARTSHVWSDVDSSQLTTRTDFWNSQIRDLYDDTLGNDEFKGDDIAKSQAFLEGLSDLREDAVEVQQWVKSQERDDKQLEQKEEKQELPKPAYQPGRYGGFNKRN